MKTLLITTIAVLICIRVNSQVSHKTITRKTATSKAVTTPNRTNANKTANNQALQSNTPPSQSTQTITERRLNGPSGTNADGSSGKTITKESPFVSGVHPAENASQSFDTLNSNVNAITTPNTQSGAIVSGGNDTTFNVNTTIQNGVNTNSGAVDRSGQSQFGQTNWGRNTRNTVGESQWTVPPPITSSFSKEFPTANSTTWSRNNADTTIYSARYKSGENWVTSRYNVAGEKMDTRFEIPMVQAPRPVSVYLAKQPSNVRITSISRLQIQGKPEVYEIKTADGTTIYINNEGMETEL